MANFEFILYNKNVRLKNACILWRDEAIKKRVFMDIILKLKEELQVEKWQVH